MKNAAAVDFGNRSQIMRTGPSNRGAFRDEAMSANILLIEYERSSVDGVRNGLTGRGHRLEVAGDLNIAVDMCAHFEPKLVIITSELAPGAGR